MNANYIYSGISGWLSDLGVHLDTADADKLLDALKADLAGEGDGDTLYVLKQIVDQYNVGYAAAAELLAKVQAAMPQILAKSPGGGPGGSVPTPQPAGSGVPTWAIVAGAAVVLLLVLKK